MNIFPDNYIPPNRQLESPYSKGLFSHIINSEMPYQQRKDNQWKFQDFIDFMEAIAKQTPLTYVDYLKQTRQKALKRFE